MSFWDPKAEEPLRQYRWFINFPLNGRLKNRDIYLDELVISLKECSKPEYDISISEHKLLNHTFRYPGVVKWKPITIKFISYLNNNKENNDSAQVLADYLYVIYYNNIPANDFINDRERKIFSENTDIINVITNPDRKPTEQIIISAMTLKEVFNLSTVELIQIAGDGHQLENWKLYNCWFSNVNFGSLSYDSEDFVTISATLQYDWAEKALRDPRPEGPAVKKQDTLSPASPQQLSPPPLALAPLEPFYPLSPPSLVEAPNPPPPKPPATTPAVAQQEVPNRQPPLPQPPPPPPPPAIGQPPPPPPPPPAIGQPPPPPPPPPPPLPPLEPFYPPEEPRLTDPPLVEAEIDDTLTSYNNPAFPSNTGTGTGTGGVTPDGGNRPPGTGTGTNNNRGTAAGNGGNLNQYANGGYPTGENPNTEYGNGYFVSSARSRFNIPNTDIAGYSSPGGAYESEWEYHGSNGSITRFTLSEERAKKVYNYYQKYETTGDKYYKNRIDAIVKEEAASRGIIGKYR